jgi:hypothetical protein
MTGNDEQTTTTSVLRVAAAPDRRLEMLIRLWENLDENGQPNTLSVSLVVQGALYSGLLVAGRVWARTMAQLLRTAPANASLAALGVFFDDVITDYEKYDTSLEPRQYLHLVSVAIGQPQGGQQTGLMLRFRVADVSAWTVGTMGELPPFVVRTIATPAAPAAPAAGE